MIVLAGDAGIGKSRLCSELAAYAEEIGATVMEGSCSETDLALPYLPFLEAIGNHLVTVDAKRLRKRLGVHVWELARVFPELDPGVEAAQGQDTSDARLRLFEAMLALLGIAGEEGGLLLIVEDLHWAGASTRELLDYLARRLRNRRILILASYRSDEMHRRHPLLPSVQGWQRSHLARIVELKALGPDGVARMTSSIFDDTDVGAEFRNYLHSRSEGNPFVLEEMLKAAIDRGDIYRENADWQRKPIAELHLPETVRDTILLRVERLDESQADVLRCAAVLGRSFDYQTLIALSEQDRASVEATLHVAVQLQLLEEEVQARGRYRFRHALTHEAIYQDLGAPTRERLHSAAADISAASGVSAAEIGSHLRAANRWQEAVAFTLVAATAAEERRGYDEAAALYSVLLPVITTGVERARLLCHLGEAYWSASRPGKAVEPLEAGIRLLEQGGQTTEGAHFRLVLGRCQWELNRPRIARLEYETARKELEPAGPSRDLALAYIRLAGLSGFAGDGPGGQKLAEMAGQTAAAVGADDMWIWSLNFLGLAIAVQGDYPTGIEHLERSAEEAFQRRLHDIAGNALHNLMPAYLESMQPHRLRELSARMESIGIEGWGFYSKNFALLMWGLQTGELSISLGAGRDVLARAMDFDNPWWLQMARLGLGLVLLELDRLGEAREFLARPRADEEPQISAQNAWLWIRFHLAAQDVPGAQPAAEFLLTQSGVATPTEDGYQAAVEAFLAAGRFPEAELALARLEAAKSPAARVAEGLARGQLAMARADADAALPLVQQATEDFDRAGLLLRGCRARLFLAEVHRRRDDLAGAEAELRRVLAAARQHSLPLLERVAKEDLAKLGIVVWDPATDESSEAGPKGELSDPARRALAAASSRLPAGVTLTKREIEIAELVATGLTNREIAGQIFLSVRTVETHVDRVLGKLDFHTRTQLAGWVRRSQP